MMANPTLTVTYNKAVYAPGETITATVAYADPDTKTVSDVWQATNANGDQATITVARNVVDPVTIVPPAGYTKVTGSDTGSQVVFTRTA
jgi:hypothetical protein